jgi:hypothetical protein
MISMKIAQLFLLFVCFNDSFHISSHYYSIYLVCFVCAGPNFYTELSNKLEPTIRGYKQMSVDANLCELVVKLTCILVKVILHFFLLEFI